MLLSFGSNGSGQLGLGHNDDVDAPVSVQVPYTNARVKSIRAGGNHTLVLLEDGRLFVSGDGHGQYGQIDDTELGTKLGGPADRHSFMEVIHGEPHEIWKLCSATWGSSTFVNLENRMLSCGAGDKGELGLSEAKATTPLPTVIVNFPPQNLSVEHIAASMSHTVAILSDGSVYGWGSGRKGQLGSPGETVWEPRRVEDVHFRATHAVCGRDFTFIVGAPETGECLLLGSDKFGLQSDMPTSVQGWKQIGATWGSVLVLKQDGQLLAWGRNDHGQLGPPDLPSLRMIAAGSEHVLALTDADEVLAWGWGEHGNCGLPTDDNGDVKGRYNVVLSRRRCNLLAAGCATSWIGCDD